MTGARKTTWTWTRSELDAHAGHSRKMENLFLGLVRLVREEAAEIGEPQAVANAALLLSTMLPAETVQAMLVGALVASLKEEIKGAE